MKKEVEITSSVTFTKTSKDCNGCPCSFREDIPIENINKYVQERINDDGEGEVTI